MKRRILKIAKFFVREKIKIISTKVSSSEVLENRVVLITGGDGGIGFGIAQAIIESGGYVILLGRNEDKLTKCCKILGSNSRFYVYDILNIKDLSTAIQNCETLFKTKVKIDTLIYSIGYHGKSIFGKITELEYDTVFDVNLKGMYFIEQEFSKYLIKNNIKGNILNISSSSALKPGWTPYEISKWGVRSLTLGFADKLVKHGIVVNAIGPGPVNTSMLTQNFDNLKWSVNPTGRMALPDEIGRLAVFMISDMGRYIIGETYYFSGGSGTIKLQNQ